MSKSELGICGKEFQCKSSRCLNVYEWNIVAATLHLFEAASCFIILNTNFWSQDKPIPAQILDIPISVWERSANSSVPPSANLTCDTVGPTFLPSDEGQFTIYDVNVPYTEFRIEWAVIAFFLLSGVFQWIAACGKITKDRTGETFYDYEALNNVERNWLRFVEYAASASLMLAIIARTSGIKNFYLIMLIAVANVGCQFFGLIAEYTRSQLAFNQEGKRRKDDGDIRARWLTTDPVDTAESNMCQIMVIAEIVGFIQYFGAYYPILSHYFESIGSDCNEASPPDFVNVIVLSQAALFFSFGVVQLSSILCSDKCRKAWWLCGNLEGAFVFLSLTAKSILAWVLFANVFFSA
jgi:hypothetical protein